MMVKKLFFLFLLTGGMYCHVFAQTKDTIFTLFPYQWGAYSFNSNDAQGNTFSIDGLNKDIWNSVDQIMIPSLKVNRDIMALYRMMERPDKSKIQYCVVPFLMKDIGFVTCRIFLYDVRNKGVTWSAFFAGDKLSEKFIRDSTVSLLNKLRIETPYNSQDFEILTYMGRADFAINEFKKALKKDPVQSQLSGKKIVNIDDLVEAIGEYYDSGDPASIKWIVRNKSSNKSIQRIAEKYPKVWKLIDAIEYYEDLINTPSNQDKTKQIEIMLNRINKIQSDVDEYTDEEIPLLKNCNIDSLSAVMCKGVTLMYACKQNLKDYADDLYRNKEYNKACALYLDILRTPNVTSIMMAKSFIGQDKDCRLFKEEAYDVLKKIYDINQKQYQSLIRESLSASLKESQRTMKINQAHKIDVNLSLFGLNLNMFDPPKDTAQYNKKNRVDDAGQYAVNAANGLPSNPMSTELNNSEIDVSFNSLRNILTIDIRPQGANDPNWRGWFSESKYRLGVYSSVNDENVARTISSFIVDINNKFPNTIDTVYLDFTGSADRSGFKSDGPIQISHEPYRKINNTVCECAQPDYKCPRCVNFRELAEGKIIDYKCPDGSVNPLFRNNSKNLALAYLRAYHRKEIVTKKILEKSDKIKIKSSICTNLAEGKGEQYRYVTMKVTIKFKKSSR